MLNMDIPRAVGHVENRLNRFILDYFASLHPFISGRLPRLNEYGLLALDPSCQSCKVFGLGEMRYHSNQAVITLEDNNSNLTLFLYEYVSKTLLRENLHVHPVDTVTGIMLYQVTDHEQPRINLSLHQCDNTDRSVVADQYGKTNKTVAMVNAGLSLKFSGEVSSTTRYPKEVFDYMISEIGLGTKAEAYTLPLHDKAFLAAMRYFRSIRPELMSSYHDPLYHAIKDALITANRYSNFVEAQIVICNFIADLIASKYLLAGCLLFLSLAISAIKYLNLTGIAFVDITQSISTIETSILDSLQSSDPPIWRIFAFWQYLSPVLSMIMVAAAPFYEERICNAALKRNTVLYVCVIIFMTAFHANVASMIAFLVLGVIRPFNQKLSFWIHFALNWLVVACCAVLLYFHEWPKSFSLNFAFTHGVTCDYWACMKGYGPEGFIQTPLGDVGQAILCTKILIQIFHCNITTAQILAGPALCSPTIAFLVHRFLQKKKDVAPGCCLGYPSEHSDAYHVYHRNQHKTSHIQRIGPVSEKPIFFDSSCCCNAASSAIRRVLADPPYRFDAQFLTWCMYFLQNVFCPCFYDYDSQVVPASQEEFLSGKPSSMRKRFLTGKQMQEAQPQCKFPIHPKVSHFVKRNVSLDEPGLAKVYKPRSISSCNETVLYVYGPWIYSLSKRVHEASCHQIAKDFTYDNMCDTFTLLHHSFGPPRLRDAAKYDLCQRVPAMQIQHYIFRSLGLPTDMDKWLLKYDCKWRASMYISTPHGRRIFETYTSNDGVRKSGDPHTSLGNNVYSHFACHAVSTYERILEEHLDPFNYSSWPLDLQYCEYFQGMVSGDDIAVFRGVKNFDLFHLMGLNLTEDDTFCSGKFLYDGTRYRYVRDPINILARLGWSVSANAQLTAPARSSLYSNINFALLSTLYDIPIISKWLINHRSKTTPKMSSFRSDLDIPYTIREMLYAGSTCIVSDSPTPDMRISFAVAYDIPLSTQLYIESNMSLTFNDALELLL